VVTEVTVNDTLLRIIQYNRVMVTGTVRINCVIEIQATSEGAATADRLREAATAASTPRYAGHGLDTIDGPMAVADRYVTGYLANGGGRGVGGRTVMHRSRAVFRRPSGVAPRRVRREPSGGRAGRSRRRVSRGVSTAGLSADRRADPTGGPAFAQAELKDKSQRIGLGAGLVGAGALVAFYGGATLVGAAVLGLATALEPWLAALIVGATLAVIGGILALVGRRKAAEALPPTPEEAMTSVHDDLQHIKEQARR
jgi:hypothetical protein